MTLTRRLQIVLLFVLEYLMAPTTAWASYQCASWCRTHDEHKDQGDDHAARRAAAQALQKANGMRAANAVMFRRLRLQGRGDLARAKAGGWRNGVRMLQDLQR